MTNEGKTALYPYNVGWPCNKYEVMTRDYTHNIYIHDRTDWWSPWQISVYMYMLIKVNL